MHWLESGVEVDLVWGCGGLNLGVQWVVSEGARG